MVKGISKQVIVLQSPKTQVFEQAIFILREDAPEVTDDQLLKEAERLCAYSASTASHNRSWLYACGGGLAVGTIWLLTQIL